MRKRKKPPACATCHCRARKVSGSASAPPRQGLTRRPVASRQSAGQAIAGAMMNPFTFNTTASIVFEPGSSRRLGEIAGKKIGKNVLFVTDPGLRRLGLCDPVLASLGEAGHDVAVFDAVEADP